MLQRLNVPRVHFHGQVVQVYFLTLRSLSGLRLSVKLAITAHRRRTSGGDGRQTAMTGSADTVISKARASHLKAALFDHKLSIDNWVGSIADASL